MRERRRSRAEWIKLCEAHAASGESAAVFARRRGVNRQTLAWWRSKLRREEGSSPQEPAAFVEVEQAPPRRSAAVVVRIGAIAIEFEDGAPPAAWVAELVARC